MLRLTLQCLFSPQLYKIYRDGPRNSGYKPLLMEKVAHMAVTTAHVLFSITMYSSPFICMYIYKRGLYSFKDNEYLVRAICSLGGFLFLSMVTRSIARVMNPKYVEFMRDFTKPISDPKKYVEEMRKYDFEFSSWPTTYSMPQNVHSSWLENRPFVGCAHPEFPIIKRITVQLLAYIATHTFALRLIYPGTLTIIFNMLWPHLFVGRTELVEVYNGKRAKVIAADGNAIDTMFVDHRSESPKGKILVICSEGNSGFYEIGIMATPVKTGYSALGWNHPGFGGSTGLPFPHQEERAIDAVIQYAIDELGFEIENMVMFGWSIGGYCATWAAVNYPSIKGLILDASFDDLLPLAQNQMPKSWAVLVKEVVRSFVDLNIADMFDKYDGQIQLVRRTEDEIISLRPAQLATNRGNDLLLKIIETRHPEFLTMDNGQVYELFKRMVILSDQQRIVMRNKELSENEKLVMKWIAKYMRDYRSTHCTLLPEEHFQIILDNFTSQNRA